MKKNLILICFILSNIAYAGERTFTYFYCHYKDANGFVKNSIFSDLLGYDGRGRHYSNLIHKSEIRDIFENRPHKEITGLHLTKSSRVSCASTTESDKSLGFDLFYFSRNNKGGKYEIMSDFHMKNEYLLGLKNLKIMRIKPLIENRNNYIYDCTSIEKIMQS